MGPVEQGRSAARTSRAGRCYLRGWGMVETELFADTYRSYGLATIRYPVLEIAATVEPFENGRGFSLRVHRAGKPRTR